MSATKEAELLDSLRKVMDPELDVSIVDLGLVAGVELGRPGAAHVRLRLTFLGCPAQSVIQEDVRRVVGALGYSDVSVEFAAEERWTTAMVGPQGQQALRSRGLVAFEEGAMVSCPHCGRGDVSQDSPFGSSVCRSTYFCLSCHTSFELLRSADCQRPIELPIRLAHRGASRSPDQPEE